MQQLFVGSANRSSAFDDKGFQRYYSDLQNEHPKHKTTQETKTTKSTKDTMHGEVADYTIVCLDSSTFEVELMPSPAILWYCFVLILTFLRDPVVTVSFGCLLGFQFCYFGICLLRHPGRWPAGWVATGAPYVETRSHVHRCVYADGWERTTSEHICS